MGWGAIKVVLDGEGRDTPSVSFGTPGFEAADGKQSPSMFFVNVNGEACFKVALTEKNFALANSEAKPRGWLVSVELSEFAKTILGVAAVKAETPVVQDEVERPRLGRPRKNKES